MTTCRFRRNTAGLTMVEVLIASTVFALMSISLLSYVQYGSQAWKTGHQRLDVGSYYRSVTDTIQRELQQADKVLEPKVGGPASSALKYDIAISSGSTYVGTATFLLEWVPSTKILQRRFFDPAQETKYLSVSSKVTMVQQSLVVSVDTDKAETVTVPSVFKFTVARDVATFTVKRMSSYTVDIAIGIESSMGGDEGRVEGKFATMTFVIPSGR